MSCREMSRRKIPIIGAVWEGLGWMLGGQPEQSRRIHAPEKYADCIDSVAQFIVTARGKYGGVVDYFSFNEPDWGVNFKFTPATMVGFIRRTDPPGSTVVTTTSDSEDFYTLAATGPTPGKFALIMANAGGAGKTALAGLTARIGVTISVRTAGKTASKAIITATGTLNVSLPPRSVTTIHD